MGRRILNEVAATEPAGWMRELLLALSGFGYTEARKAILIKISEQRLYVLQNRRVMSVYSVSTSRHGTGNQAGSHKTPLGAHRIAEKIGDGCRAGEIIKARKPTGRLAAIIAEPYATERDAITTRILWLAGLEPGVNLGADVDSYARYIYIHGTPEEGLIGQPASIGCIRMKNADVIDLFNSVDEGTLVHILA